MRINAGDSAVASRGVKFIFNGKEMTGSRPSRVCRVLTECQQGAERKSFKKRGKRKRVKE